MSESILNGLSLTGKNRICIEQCKASCCRDPYILVLEADEVKSFQSVAVDMGLDLKIQAMVDGSAWVKFSDHLNQSCPMLDSGTSICRIYNNRPSRCRLFPGKPIPGCAISGN